MRSLLGRFKNVAGWVNGHTHANTIRPIPSTRTQSHPGFWQITSASHIDWPQQSRIVEIAVDTANGDVVIGTAMLDHLGLADPRGGDLDDPRTLAGWSRELSANAWQGRCGGELVGRGDARDRNAPPRPPGPVYAHAMTTARQRLVVVGGGILGTMHAVEGVRRGYEVVQLERDQAPEGASVRNFGLIWVSGRAAGAELEFALEARDRWEAIAADAPGTGFRPIGSLTIARSKEELSVLAAVVDAPDAERRGVVMFEPEEARALNPALKGDLEGALFCERDAAVEPRLALGALRAYLARSDAYRYEPWSR